MASGRDFKWNRQAIWYDRKEDVTLNGIVWHAASPKGIVLYLHGGTLIGGECDKDCSPAFRESCAAANLTVVSMNYRLLPQTEYENILVDAKDYEEMFLNPPSASGLESTKGSDIIVVGASAGALLAFHTTKWTSPPKAIVALYPITDLILPYDGNEKIPMETPKTPGKISDSIGALLDSERTKYVSRRSLVAREPPTLWGILGKCLIRENLFAAIVLNHWKQNDAKPGDKPSYSIVPVDKKHGLQTTKLKKLNPVQYLEDESNEIQKTTRFVSIHGTKDLIFDIKHSNSLHETFKREKVDSLVIEVKNQGHAFDTQPVNNAITKEKLTEAWKFLKV